LETDTNMSPDPLPNRERASEKSRADMLAEIAGLPSSAFINTALAAAYLGSTPGVLESWRSQRRGPRYYGRHQFVRYRLGDLDAWMAGRANETAEQEKLDETPIRALREAITEPAP
jgi:hypothetical protein